jgi:chromosome segregation ATPase
MAFVGVDTPRTNLGDATYLTQQPQFDISQEPSFQSPSKDNNDLLQLQNGRRGAVNLKTPRSRAPFGDRRNLPPSNDQFTPLLKSATRNSALKFGKENGILQTPAFLKPGALQGIAEDISPVPHVGSSVYDDSRNGTYINGTPVPNIENSSAASTPMALLPRRTDGANVLQDGNQLSLREQESIIDKIEKENFGLKLKIHFLEEALRKAGPGFSEAALKENTELKVDKVTMQKELHRYRKTLTAAERDLEAYRQQILEMQERAKRKHVDEGQQEELNRRQQALEEKESEVQSLRDQLRDLEEHDGQVEKLRDEISDLEADLRKKDRIIDEQEDEVDNLRSQLNQQSSTISELEEAVKTAKRREVELEEKAQFSDEFAEAKDTIEGLEQDINRLRVELQEAKEDCHEAMAEKNRAESDLEELQEEMANKSITTKGLSRQIEEKANRLQDELEDLRETHLSLEKQYAYKLQEVETLLKKVASLEQNGAREAKLKDDLDLASQERKNLLDQLQSTRKELLSVTDAKDLLQIRHDALTSESAGLQKDLAKARASVGELEDKLDQEKTLALKSEREVRDQYKGEIDRLNDEIEDLRADIREKERLYDDESDKWETDRRNLESQRDRADEHAAGLQRTIDKLQAAEGTLSSKEVKMKEALESEKERHLREEAALNREIEELNATIESRRQALEEARTELFGVKEELRLSQREQKLSLEKIQGLEDEIEVLQASMDDENDRANAELATAKKESEELQKELYLLKENLDSQLGKASQEQLDSILRDTEAQLTKVRREKQDLQDQLARVKVEMHSLRSTAAEIEAERDEVKSQLKEMKRQEEDTFRLDQEKIELRTTKMKLDNEVRRLREETRALSEQLQATERELQQEIEKANAKQIRLDVEITDLQSKLAAASSNRELISAKRTVQHLESRIKELEAQIASANSQSEVNNELSVLRRDLSDARQKETEYIQREVAQKDIMRGLKRQISELERKAHDLEVSRLQSASFHSSTSDSARKSEIFEVRQQLASAHQTLRDLRAQLKEVERDANRRVAAATAELQSKTSTWESEKFTLERDIDNAIAAREEFVAKNTAAEKTVARLRSKIDRLEKELQAERRNASEDRTMALERRDLHEMLRDAQIQAEELELELKNRDEEIAKITAAESELRSQLKRAREERVVQRDRAAKSTQQLNELQLKFRQAKEAWEEEKSRLNHGVRFPNTSVSELRGNESLLREREEREKKHVKELRGLAMQIEWLRARCRREEGLRADAAYAKRFMLLQIELFSAWWVLHFSFPPPIPVPIPVPCS